MIVRIHVVNSVIKWDELVGKEHDEFGYNIIVNSYSYDTKILSISEFHNEYPYTNEIILVDEKKAIDILLNYGFEIELIREFSYTSATIYKMQGLSQAGFTYITYDKNSNRFMVDNMFEVTFLTDEEFYHLIAFKDTSILINDIINNNI